MNGWSNGPRRSVAGCSSGSTALADDAARRRGPRTGPLRRDRDRHRPRARTPDASRDGRHPAGRLRSRRPARRRRPPRERHQALPAADHRRPTARRRARPDHRRHQGSPMTTDRAAVIHVANYIDGLGTGHLRRDAREPRPGDRRPRRDRPAVRRRGRRPRDRRGPRHLRRWGLAGDVGPRACRDPVRAGAAAARGGRAALASRRDGDGQADPLRPRARDRARHRPDPVLRQRRPDDPRRGDRVGAEPPAQLHPQGAGRGVRADHAVERPGRPPAAQDRRGHRHRLHVRAQAGQRRAGVVDGDLRAARPDRGAAAAASPTASSGRRGRRRGAGDATRGSTRSASPAAARSDAG